MPAPARVSKQRYGTVPSLALLATGAQDTFAIAVRGRRLSAVLSWTGTPTGVISLLCTFDGTTYVTVPGASAEFTANGNLQPAGGASSMVVNFSNVPGTAVKFRYTATSGTGTLLYIPVFGD